MCTCVGAYLTCSSAMILSPSSSSSPAAEVAMGGGVTGFGLVSGGTLVGFALGVGGEASSSPSCLDLSKERCFSTDHRCKTETRILWTNT